MLKYRKFIIVLPNLIAISWLIKLFCFSTDSTDFMGILFWGVIFILIIYDIYSILLYNKFPKNEKRVLYIEIVFTLLSVAPIFLLYLIFKK